MTPRDCSFYTKVSLQDRVSADEDRIRERLLSLLRRMLDGRTSGIVAVLEAFAQNALTEELLELGAVLASGGGDDGGGNGGGGTM